MMFFSVKNVSFLPGNLTYSDTRNLPQHYVQSWKFCSGEVAGRPGLIIEIIVTRPLFSSIITTFMPTSIMVLLSHVVNRFHQDNLEMVIQVNLTLILVLATL